MNYVETSLGLQDSTNNRNARRATKFHQHDGKGAVIKKLGKDAALDLFHSLDNLMFYHRCRVCPPCQFTGKNYMLMEQADTIKGRAQWVFILETLWRTKFSNSLRNKFRRGSFWQAGQLIEKTSKLIIKCILWKKKKTSLSGRWIKERSACRTSTMNRSQIPRTEVKACSMLNGWEKMGNRDKSNLMSY